MQFNARSQNYGTQPLTCSGLSTKVLPGVSPALMRFSFYFIVGLTKWVILRLQRNAREGEISAGWAGPCPESRFVEHLHHLHPNGAQRFTGRHCSPVRCRNDLGAPPSVLTTRHCPHMSAAAAHLPDSLYYQYSQGGSIPPRSPVHSSVCLSIRCIRIFLCQEPSVYPSVAQHPPHSVWLDVNIRGPHPRVPTLVPAATNYQLMAPSLVTMLTERQQITPLWCISSEEVCRSSSALMFGRLPLPFPLALLPMQ